MCSLDIFYGYFYDFFLFITDDKKKRDGETGTHNVAKVSK